MVGIVLFKRKWDVVGFGVRFGFEFGYVVLVNI